MTTEERAKEIHKMKISELSEIISQKRRIVNNLMDFKPNDYLLVLNIHLKDLEILNKKLDILLNE